MSMSKMNMATPYDSNNGKYARTDQIYFKIRKFDERTLGVRMKHPATNEPPTAGQQAAQAKMKAVAAQVKTALADPQLKATYKEKWLKQRKCKTLMGFVFRELYNAQQQGG